jgi:GTP-binding protein Era
MVAAAWDGAEEADAILLVVDAAKKHRDYLEPILEQLQHRKERKILVLNKVDLTAKEPLLVLAQELTQKVDFAEVFFVSAQSNDGVAGLKAHLAGLMPEGLWHFPEDQVSDASERLMACEITREQLYRQLHDELPYDSTVRPESYKSARTVQLKFINKSSSPERARNRLFSARKARASGPSARRHVPN